MGQYYLIVNLDKQEYIRPHAFGDGAKLLEFGASGGGAMLGLAVLLADGNNRGGGDLRSDNPIIGSWAGDRIVVAGDYADPGKFLDLIPTAVAHLDGDEPSTLYALCDHFKDVSTEVMLAICDDSYCRQELNERIGEWARKDMPAELREKLGPAVKKN